jgi:hypothetical protein
MIVLKGIFQQFSSWTYPNCMDYEKYNWKNDRWELDMKHAKEYYPIEYVERLKEIEIENREEKLKRILNIITF